MKSIQKFRRDYTRMAEALDIFYRYLGDHDADNGIDEPDDDFTKAIRTACMALEVCATKNYVMQKKLEKEEANNKQENE